MRSLTISALVITFVLLAMTFPVMAEVPSSMTVQGRLLDSQGSPIPDGSHAATFSVWSDSTGGLRRWFENGDIPTEDGRFSGCMGCVTPFADVFSSGPAWLEITVEGQTLTPRLRLSSVPYAFSSSKITGDIVTKPGGMTLSDADSYFDLDSDDDGVTMELRESPTRQLQFTVDATGPTVRLRESPTRRTELSATADACRVAVGDVNGDGAIDLFTSPQLSEITVNEEGVRRVTISGGGGGGAGGEVTTAREAGSGMATGRRSADATIFTDSTGFETARYHKGHVTILKAHDTDESVYMCPDSISFTDATGVQTARYDGHVTVLKSGESSGTMSADGLDLTSPPGQPQARYKTGHVTLMKFDDFGGEEESSRLTPDSLVFSDATGSPSALSSRYHEWRWSPSQLSRIDEDCDDADPSITIEQNGNPLAVFHVMNGSGEIITAREAGSGQATGRRSAEATIFTDSTGTETARYGRGHVTLMKFTDTDEACRMTPDSLVMTDSSGEPSMVSSRYHEWRWNNSSGMRIDEDCDGTDASIAIDEAGAHRISMSSSSTSDQSGISIDEPGVHIAMTATSSSSSLSHTGDLDGDGTSDIEIESGFASGADGTGSGRFAIKEQGVRVVDLSSSSAARRLEIRNLGSSGEDGVELRANDTGTELKLWHKEPGSIEIPNVSITSDASGGVVLSDVLRLRPRDTAPSSPVEGEIYIDAVSHHIYCFAGGVWKQLDN